MSNYEGHNWQSGDLIETEYMNNIETGITNLINNKEEVSNKTNVIDYIHNDDIHYPTVAAVYNLFNTIQDGNNISFPLSSGD